MILSRFEGQLDEFFVQFIARNLLVICALILSGADRLSCVLTNWVLKVEASLYSALSIFDTISPKNSWQKSVLDSLIISSCVMTLSRFIFLYVALLNVFFLVYLADLNGRSRRYISSVCILVVMGEGRV